MKAIIEKRLESLKQGQAKLMQQLAAHGGAIETLESILQELNTPTEETDECQSKTNTEMLS